jgi:putative transposase
MPLAPQELRSKLDVWQSGFTKRRIEDSQDCASHLTYIHENPVRAHLCARAEDFPYSSATEAEMFPLDPVPAHLKTQG